MEPQTESPVTLSPEELSALRGLIPGRDEVERERVRQADLAEWRALRRSTTERMAKDQADLAELIAKHDRMKYEAIDAFWRQRAAEHGA